MEAKALAKYVGISPRKMRIVANEVRGVQASKALGKLQFMPQVSAKLIEKTIQSAVHNLLDKSDDVLKEDIVVSQIFVDGAPMMKRIRPVSRGRAHRILKRSSHLTVVVSVKKD
jgi:large subunit ribosomal protein L22